MGALRLMGVMGNASLDGLFLPSISSVAFTPFILSVQKNISLLVKSKRDNCLCYVLIVKTMTVRRHESKRSRGAYRRAR